MNNIFKKVLIRLLRESKGSADGLAALTFNTSIGRTAILYDPTDLVENFEEILDPDQRARFFEDYGVADIVKGVVAVRKVANWAGKCHGAWQIDYVAGPGWGHILYPIAQALTPEGLLTPDRTSVSDDAASAWEKSLKLGRPRLKFDNVKDPKTPPKEDDCLIDPERDHLNWAYGPKGGEADLLATLEQNHWDAMSHIPTDSRQEITSILREEADIFVDNNLPPGDI